MHFRFYSLTSANNNDSSKWRTLEIEDFWLCCCCVCVWSFLKWNMFFETYLRLELSTFGTLLSLFLYIYIYIPIYYIFIFTFWWFHLFRFTLIWHIKLAIVSSVWSWMRSDQSRKSCRKQRKWVCLPPSPDWMTWCWQWTITSRTLDISFGLCRFMYAQRIFFRKNRNSTEKTVSNWNNRIPTSQ